MTEEKRDYGNLKKSKKQKMLKQTELLKFETLAGDRENKNVNIEKK